MGDWIKKTEEPMFRVLELIAAAVALGYMTYSNASQVPALKDSIAEVKTEVAVLKAQYGTIQDSLNRIEDKLK